MKLPITDEFLWDLYTFLDKAENAVDFILDTRYAKWSRLSGGQNPIYEKYRKEGNERKFSKLIHYLKKNNLIKVKNLEGKKALVLTKEGLSRAFKASFIMEGKQERMDGKWIMLMFDVPEKYRKLRELLRGILSDLGYKMFQQSVWITPYDVSEKTEKLLQMYSLDKYVKIFLIEKI